MTRVRISIVAAFAALVMVLPQPALAQNGAGELSAAPFVQALVGLAHAAVDAETTSNLGGAFTFDESTSDAAIDLGGGVNIGLTDNMRLRLAASYVSSRRRRGQRSSLRGRRRIPVLKLNST